MKKVILYLLLAQAVATGGALVSNGGVYTLLVIYAIQSVLLVLLIVGEGLKYAKGAFKLMHLFQGFIDLVFALGVLFMVVILKLEGEIYINDVPTVINLGSLSIPAVIVGSAVFLMEYFREAHYLRAKAIKHEFVRSTRSYFIMFLRNVATFLVLFVAVTFNQNSDLTIIMIALIKTTLDISLVVLERALLHVDMSMTKFFPKLK